MPVFIYSKRRARLSKEPQYVELIPKLYNDLYNNDNLSIEDIFDIKLFKEYTYYEIFERFLRDQTNLLHKSEYIDKNDIEHIIHINLELFKTIKFNEKSFVKFVEYLHRGHADMEYGLYFSSMVADNYLDFLEKIKTTQNRLLLPDNDQRILYYINLTDLLKHINKIKREYDFKSPLCYFNKNWNYGKMNNNSFEYKNINSFTKQIVEKNRNIYLTASELICQIPLPNELFKFIFTRQGGRRTRKGRS